MRGSIKKQPFDPGERKKLREAAATKNAEAKRPIITPMTLTLQKMMNLVPSAARLSI